MNRRNYMGLLGGGLLASITPTLKLNDTSHNSVELEVSVFFDSTFTEIRDVGNYTTPIETALEKSVESIPDENESINLKVRFPDYTPEPDIDTTGFGTRKYDSIDGRTKSVDTVDSEELMEWWGKQINDEGEASKYASYDSNILITGNNISTYDGFGRRPTSCGNVGDSNIGIVNLFDEEFSEEIVNGKRDLSGDGRLLNTIIHEFGHNIGLTHEMGGLADDGVVTPMIGSYVKYGNREYTDRENHFGEYIPPESDFPNDVYISPTFNSDIGIDDLFTGCTCENH